MNALATITIGTKYTQIANITHPFLRRYANKIGADFVVIDDTSEEFNVGSEMNADGIPPHFAKFKVNHLFDKYDRIIFVDTDLIIRPDCPDLFSIVPEDKFGIFCEGVLIPQRKRDLLAASEIYSVPLFGIPDITKWKGQYYNTGVMVISKQHKTVLSPPDFNNMKEIEGETALDRTEQGWLNLQLINGEIPIHNLEYKFNHMSVVDNFTGEHRLCSYIVHYAGCWDMPDLPQFIQQDADKWERCGGDYSVFKRGIYIRVGGGLGDQIESEPVVRYIAEEAYPDAEILVASDWPRIFQHIDIICDTPSKIDNYATPDQPYYKMETLPTPESLFGVTVSHPLIHHVDYAALSCLKTTLPHQQKNIKLEIEDEDLESIGYDPQTLCDSIVIHPGRGWPSKTFPSEWWQEVIDELSKEVTLCFIGKHINENQGLVDIDIPRNSIDLRDKTNLGELFAVIGHCRVCITNDSSPAHIAGAFDNYLIVIPTCKHPDHVVPWRHGSQHYRTSALYNRLTIDDICNLPTEIHGQTIDWVKNQDEITYDCTYKHLKGGSILPYLPSTGEVVRVALHYYKQSLEGSDGVGIQATQQ